MKQIETLAEAIEVYYDNPVAFLEDILGMTPDPWQAQTAKDLAEYPRVAVKSGQGVGKTALEAGIILWYLTCRPEARVVATAPTMQQLYDVLWTEIYKWLSTSPIQAVLKWTKTKVVMIGSGETWFAVAKTATRPENMQGYHADHMLFVVDEASGISDAIMEAIRGTLSGFDNRLLLMGNPTQTTGTFYDAFHSDLPLWRVRTVSSRESSRTSKENILSLENKYGKDSNVVRVRVDGEFPSQEDDVFIPAEWIFKSARETEITPDTQKALGEYRVGAVKRKDYSKARQVEIGCDVARFGDDSTCIAYRINEVIRFYKKERKKDTTWTAATISLLYKELHERYPHIEHIPVKIDVGGVGGGVVDQLVSFKRTYPEEFKALDIVSVNFGKPMSNNKYYYDTTTAMMGVVRDLIQPTDALGQPKTPEIILPDDDDLIAQLSCRKYDFASNGKQRVESKDDMKDRGLRSPDEADCILLVCLPMKYKRKRLGNEQTSEREGNSGETII